jgi:hypothetical protein
VESLARLRLRSCIIDGEAVCCGDDGVPSFEAHPLSPTRRWIGSSQKIQLAKQ